MNYKVDISKNSTATEKAIHETYQFKLSLSNRFKLQRQLENPTKYYNIDQKQLEEMFCKPIAPQHCSKVCRNVINLTSNLKT